MWKTLVVLCFSFSTFLLVMPIGFNRAFHLIFPPSDLYSEVLIKEFSDFNDLKGNYQFACKYKDIYELGVRTEDKVFEVMTDMDFENFSHTSLLSFRLRIYSNDELLMSDIIKHPIQRRYFREDFKFYRKLVFSTFSIKDCNDVALVLDNIHTRGLYSGNVGKLVMYVSVSKVL